MTAPSSDFNADALVRTSEEHEKSLKELQRSIECLESRVGTNENFGKTLLSASHDSIPLQESISSVVTKSLQHDIPTQDAVEAIVTKIDNRQLKKQLTSMGKVAAWVISLIITAVVTAWITSFFNKPR